MLDKNKKDALKTNDYKLADNFLNLKMADTNVVIEHLEQAIKLREMPIEAQIKNKLRILKE